MSLSSEIAADNPTHWWKLDATGGTLADSGVGTSNDMTVVGSLTGATGPDSGGGQRFDSGDYATGSSAIDMPSGAQAFTLAGFFAPDVFSGDQVFFGFGGASTDTAAFLGMSSGVLRCGFYADDMVSTAGVFSSGALVHVAATYDGNVTARLYINGAKVATKTFGSPLNITASAPFLGRLGVSPFGQAFTGTAAHVYIMNGIALSHARIAAHAAASNVAVVPVSPCLNRSPNCPTIGQLSAYALHTPYHSMRI